MASDSRAGSSPVCGTNINNLKFNKIMNKRIFVVIEFNQYDIIAQGAFNTEEEAYSAMEAWRGNSKTNWTVKSCTLNN